MTDDKKNESDKPESERVRIFIGTERRKSLESLHPRAVSPEHSKD